MITNDTTQDDYSMSGPRRSNSEILLTSKNLIDLRSLSRGIRPVSGQVSGQLSRYLINLIARMAGVF